MNTALGIANSLNHYVTLFANSLTQPIQPQITKSYAAGDYARTDMLLATSIKLSFLLMLFIGIPFFVDAEWLIHLWLGQVPAYAVNFTLLLIIDNIVQSFNSGISLVLFADGRIKLYQIWINALRVLAVIVAYFVLKAGAPPETLFVTYIVFSVMIVFATQWCLKKTLNYNLGKLFAKAYLPSLLTIVCTLPVFLLPQTILAPVRIIICLLYYLLVLAYVGLNQNERKYVFNKIQSFIASRVRH